jgi:SAM-dependent methyltransferase
MFKKMIAKYILYLSKSAYDDHVENLKKLLTSCTGVLLDVGCGAGFIFEKRQNQIIGVDINRASSKIAKQKMGDVILADLNRGIPIRSKAIDIVYSDQVIEHLIDTDMFAEEILRVVKDDGFAVIGTENLASWHNIYALLLGKQPSSGPYVSSKFKIGYHPIWREIDKRYLLYWS